MMLSPSESCNLDLEAVAKGMDDEILRSNRDMVEFMHRGVKLTLYPNGSMMFYHFTDLDVASSYADEMMATINGER